MTDFSMDLQLGTRKYQGEIFIYATLTLYLRNQVWN